jgi:hypothetical protein
MEKPENVFNNVLPAKVEQATPVLPIDTPDHRSLVKHEETDYSYFIDVAKFQQLQRVANVFASSDLVPNHYKNNIANCFLALQLAMRLNMDPFAFMQNTYMLQGKIGIEGKLVIALINSRGNFNGNLNFEWSGVGDTRECKAFAKTKKGMEVSRSISYADAKKAGWTERNKGAWGSYPDQMLAYRAAAWFARLYCPEVLLGMQTKEELEDVSINIVDNAQTSNQLSISEKLDRNEAPALHEKRAVKEIGSSNFEL